MKILGVIAAAIYLIAAFILVQSPHSTPPQAVCSTDLECRDYAIAHGSDHDGGPYPYLERLTKLRCAPDYTGPFRCPLDVPLPNYTPKPLIGGLL